MSTPLLTISNHHSPNCGDPPIVDDRDPDIVGYFANAFGEQWIFTHDRKSGVSELRGGDAGWNSPFPVKDGIAKSVVLNSSESAWLAACWEAAVDDRKV